MAPSSSCTQNRRFNYELVQEIQKRTGYTEEEIEHILTSTNTQPNSLTEDTLRDLGVSLEQDRVESQYEKKAHYYPKDSTSLAEVKRFVRYIVAYYGPDVFTTDLKKRMQEDKKVGVAWALLQIYTGGTQLFAKPDGKIPHAEKHVDFSYWKDGDTPVLYLRDNECYFNQHIVEFFGEVRENGVDAPELGRIEDKDKEATLKRYREFKVMWEKGEFHDLPREGYRLKLKLVDNCIKVFYETVLAEYPNIELNDDEIFLSLQLIAIASDYAGKFSKVFSEDFTSSIEDKPRVKEEDYLMIVPSAIYYTSTDTPQNLCYYIDDFDGIGSGRLLASFKAKPKQVDSFVKEHLGASISALSDFHASALQDAKTITDKLNASQTLKIRELAQLFGPTGLPLPEFLYPAQKIAETRKTYFTNHPERAACKGYWTCEKTLWGSVTPYEKYRGVDYKTFRDAGDFARQNGLGITTMEFIRRLNAYNSRDPRFSPPTCQPL